MPARQNPPPPGSQRRRPGPVMPNSWIWLVILATVVVGMTLMPGFAGSNNIDWSQFNWLLRNEKIERITFKDDHIVGEVKPDKMTDDVKDHLSKDSKGKFSTYV